MTAALRTLRMLTRYTAWADARLYAAVAGLPQHELAARRATGAGSLLGTLGHAWVVDQIWQAHLEGRPHGYTTRNAPTAPTLATLQAGQEALDAWYIACADAMDERAHDEVVNFHFVDGGAGAMQRGDILLHVVNHKTYHRGYVAQMLYEAGSRPPVMDLPVFLRDVPQAPAADPAV